MSERALSFGYDADLLRTTFGEYTKGMANWKMPIEAEVAGCNLDLAIAAMVFMAGGECTVSMSAKPGFFKVAHQGYYHHVGA